ncbi:MAG: glycoside hydrolase family 2 protein [Candidatus Cyclobacteriaceae bacterium M3_2C_046]
MKWIIWLLLMMMAVPFYGQHLESMSLNGTWQFDQTEKAFPPVNFTRTIPVPGLIHLAKPKIDDYEKFFKRPDQVEAKTTHSLYDIDYTPQYSWYRKMVEIPADKQGKEVVLTILKSQYVTQLYINGHDFGTYIECYTPIEANITSALKYGEENEILIRVGDRTWLPSEAAGSTDKEKERYLPGIWDDVYLSFSGKIRVKRLLLLPDLEQQQVTAKIQLRNFYPAQIGYGDQMLDTVRLQIRVQEKKSGRLVSKKTITGISKRDNISQLETIINIPDPVAWSPDNPFLYEVQVEVRENNNPSDIYKDHVGLRDFTRRGKYFYLNQEKIFLRGTNITLQRFFEDPDCGGLVWDREWVKKLLIDYPKQMHWNAMRICVGIVPDFWYDIADEHGIMFQNEWLYWQNHGWDEQIRKEYTDWVWSDGSHPSIVIWDAINENWDDFIGNVLIPELMELDPTRIWDAGYMTDLQLTSGLDEMDEPHPYEGPMPWIDANQFKSEPYPLGNLDYRNQKNIESIESGAAQLVNEYGWIWLWRNGQPSKLTVGVYQHYLGENATVEERRALQAYWLQAETEWLRSVRQHAGVLAFCYLTNNYGYTGDWFINDIADLEPGPVMDWFRHAFAPAAVFINLTDERYTRFLQPHQPGSELLFNLTGINDHSSPVNGIVNLKLYNDKGQVVLNQDFKAVLPPDIQKEIPVSINLPEEAGGYTLVSEFSSSSQSEPMISRRYVKVGWLDQYDYFEIKPKQIEKSL